MFDSTFHAGTNYESSLLSDGVPDTLASVEPFAHKTLGTFFSGPSTVNLRPKIVLYSHDTFGLGNIRRTLLLAQTLIDQYPEASILIITGSPVIHAFRLPAGVDYIKLPSLDRVGAEKYEPLSLANCGDEVRHTRRAIVGQIITGFAPDLLIVDKRAAGINGELLEALKVLKKNGHKTKIVLGLRDILDSPERTSRVLRENGSFDIIEEFYDEVWIYGSSEIFDTAREYDFPYGVRQKTHYCGYLKRPVAQGSVGNGELRVLVTTGGGGDGSRMIETYLESLPLLEAELPVSSTVVFGPQIEAAKRDGLLARFGKLPNVKFSDFEADLTQLYSDADVVVSMAGYNTVCELLSHKKRAVLVPRSEPVREQLIRARLLAKHGLFQVIEPADLTAETMKNKIIAAVKSTSLAMHLLDLDGLRRIDNRVRELLTEEVCNA